MNHDRPSYDDHSIWATRPSLEDEHTPLHRRARAGTLPSRLPSRLDTTSHPRVDLAADPSHHGSLALISPDGNDIVYDRPSSNSRSAVGQQLLHDSRRTPPLASIPEPPVIDNPHDGPAGTGNIEDDCRLSSASGGGINSGLSSSGSALSSALGTNGLSSSGSILNTGSTAGRTRSGSVNSLASSTYRPFGQSIWKQPGGIPNSLSASSGTLVGTLPSSLGPPLPNGSSAPGSATSNSSAGSTAADPLMVFTNELNKTSNPGRIRSYTLDGGADWAPPQPSPHFVRGRAQTLMGVSAVSAPISLGRFGKQHEVATMGGVDIGELSPVPTAALWISNVPPQATPYTLHTLFGSFGRIESARVIPARCCAYVLFASTVQAIEAQATANGSELYAGSGPSTVGFAQVTPASHSVAGTINPITEYTHTRAQSTGNQVSPELAATSIPNGNPIVSSSPSVSSIPNGSSTGGSPGSAAYILQMLGSDRMEVSSGVAHLTRASKIDFNVPLKPLSELLEKDIERVYNTAALRELRRKLEHQAPSADILDIVLDMQKELPLLVSDYIGNTVVQLVFEAAPSVARDMMLRRLGNVFAATGMHKNGTWAVQKMIDLARGPRQYALCAQAIQPHLVPLLLDQFGNYVVQGCLKFHSPYSDFVYAGIAASLPKIAPNRFGARAIRAVLESSHTSQSARRLVATAIVQQLPTLATNPNGSLLVSWLLDHAHGPSDEETDKASDTVEGEEMPTQNGTAYTASNAPGSSELPGRGMGHSVSASSSSSISSASSHNSTASNSAGNTAASTLSQQLRTHALVAAQLVPQHMVALCTSKLGAGIVLKLATSAAPAASQRLFDSLFEPLSDNVPLSLTQILADPSGQGPTCIYRLLSVFPGHSIERQVAVSKVRAVLVNGGVSHRRLMEEVGLESSEEASVA